MIARRAAAAAALAAPLCARAQAFPQRNLTILVPAAPGGTLDALARFFAQAMGPNLERTVVVENVTGAADSSGSSASCAANPTATRCCSATWA